MGIAFDHRASVVRHVVSGGGIGCSVMPPEIAFLREYGVSAKLLEAALRDAQRLGVGAVEALLAAGRVSDTLFYMCLAGFVGVPFHSGAAILDPATRPLRALRAGCVRLADGTHLLAPTGPAITLLVKGARKRDLMPLGFAIVTPARLEALVLRRAGDPLARRASLALPALEPKLSAKGAAGWRAALAAVGVVVAAGTGFAAAPALLAAVAGTSFVAAIGLRWLACATALLPASPTPPVAIGDRDLPRYSVLVPLSREAGMVPGLVAHLGRLDYPAAKLEILFLVEADDASTLAALDAIDKPAFMRTLVVPPGSPRTKPRALNLGLALATGALIAVFDAEDRPALGQLRAAAAHYASAPRDLACVQARLSIADGNLLQRLFALEYAVLFELFDPGLARLGLPLPLGGTSNHFRAAPLRAVGGWDAWNVTEDADLGFRLVRFGYRVDMLASRTWEEAPGRLAIWIKQRRRWTKGWMQVALVLLRDRSAFRDLGVVRGLAVALMLVGMVVGPLATPIVLLVAVCQLGWSGWLHGALAETALAVPVIAVAATLWCGWAASRGRTLAERAFLPLLLLPYQLLIAGAAWGGLVDLVLSPHHWRKTPHGAEALNRSSRAAPRPRRRALRPATRG